MVDTIVVGMDGSPGADAALAWALEVARDRDVRVEAVMAWDWLGQPRRRDGLGFDPDFDQDAAGVILDEVVDAVVRRSGAEGLEVDRRAVLDLPVRALLTAARDATLLVVGRRGLGVARDLLRGGVGGMLLGSVSQQVLAHAPCPVVVVPDTDDRAAGPAADGTSGHREGVGLGSRADVVG